MSWEGKGLGAVVVLYGSGIQPTDDQLKTISVPMLGLYGEADGGIPVDRIKTWESKLKEFGKINEMVIYKEAPHAFFNDTRPSYREAAAKDAWVRALAWFRKYLTDEVATPVATMAATAAK
jgi:carboxymethylenebutenolidase